MPGRQKCDRCNKVKANVELCGDDLLCRPCEVQNAAELAAIRAKSRDPPSEVGRASATVQPSGKSSSKIEPAKRLRCDNRTAAGAVADADDSQEVFCPVCHCQAASDEKCVVCDICQSRYHFLCTGLTKEVCAVLATIVKHTGWVCVDCRSTSSTKLATLQSSLSRANEEIADMRVSIAWLYEEITSAKQAFTDAHFPPLQAQAARAATNDQSSLPDTNCTPNHVRVPMMDASQIHVEVHRSIQDAAKRKSNVVISGFPEGPDTNQDDDDSVAFVNFCEANLSVKPALTNKGCRRLGARGTDKPRRLLVHLTSEASAANLLSAAKSLRHNDETKTIYINPDLTPAEARLAYERRQHRRTVTAAKQRVQNEPVLCNNTPETQASAVVVLDSNSNSHDPSGVATNTTLFQ